MKLTKKQAQEVLHKLGILANEPDLQDDYGLTQSQATELLKSVPHKGGEWSVPDWARDAVRGELENAAHVCRSGLADWAKSSGDVGGMLAEHRLANQLEKLAEAI